MIKHDAPASSHAWPMPTVVLPLPLLLLLMIQCCLYPTHAASGASCSSLLL